MKEVFLWATIEFTSETYSIITRVEREREAWYGPCPMTCYYYSIFMNVLVKNLRDVHSSLLGHSMREIT